MPANRKRLIKRIQIVSVLKLICNIIFSGPYGIFARHCRAQGENQAEFLDLIDDKGCPLHAELFPQLQKNGSALETQFLAFRFRKSFQVFYQCTVDYCVDSCPPVSPSTHLGRTLQCTLQWTLHQIDANSFAQVQRKAAMKVISGKSCLL